MANPQASSSSQLAAAETCRSFGTTYSYFSQAAADPKVVLDEGGPADAWRDHLLDRLRLVDDYAEPQDVEEERSALWMQAQTWTVLSALYDERLYPSTDGPTARELIAADPYASPASIVAAIYDEPEMREWMIVRDILTAAPPYASDPAPHVRAGYLPGTTRELKRALRTSGGKLDAVQGGMTRSLDLDCDVRAAGTWGAGRLAGEDAAKTTATLQAIFLLIRRGELNKAIEYCIASDEPWRAASLEGGKPWTGGRGKGVARGGDDDENMETDSSPAEGNINRRLWKNTCRAIARNTKLHPYERAIYGSLAGDLDSVLPVCKTWEDHLWAHVNALIENRLDKRLSEVGGYWWNRQANIAESKASIGQLESLEDVFNQIERISREGVSTFAQNPFHQVQKHIVLDRADKAIKDFASSLHELDQEYAGPAFELLVQFFAHLVLYIPLLDIEVDEPAKDDILARYISYLTQQGQHQLVAAYTAEMAPGAGEDRYARFLRGKQDQDGQQDRWSALQNARDNGLDVARIAWLVVEPTLKTLRYKMSSDVPLPFFQPVLELKNAELHVIRCLEWLTYDEATYPRAIHAANLMLRFYLGANNLPAVHAIFRAIPDEVTDVCKTQAEADEGIAASLREFLIYKRLNRVLGMLQKAEDEWQVNPTLVVDSYNATTSLLRESGWTTDPLDGADELHWLTYDRVKRLMIPEMIFRLHNLLVQTPVPANHQRALALSTLIADERYQIFASFLQPDSKGDWKGAEYLELVRELSLELMRRNEGKSVFELYDPSVV